MFRKTATALLGLIIFMGSAIAQVDVNKADQAALDGIKGIGPTKSRMILEERKKGAFKDWSDFEARVKGIGGKSAIKLSGAGLTVNGKARDAVGSSQNAAPSSQTSDKTSSGASSKN